MKKILLLFLLVVITSFSWEVIEMDNESKKVGIAKYSKDNKSIINIMKYNTDIYCFSLISNKYIGGKDNDNTFKVKIKLDSDDIMEFNGIDLNEINGFKHVIIFKDQDDKIKNLLEKMKKKNNMKIVAEKPDGNSLISEFNITKLNDVFFKVK